jgi:hypothetical protein
MIALQNHPPAIVYGLLFLLGLLCSLLAGIRMASGQRRNWLHWVTFSLVTASVVYVTIDMEYPRVGLIRLETGGSGLDGGSSQHEVTAGRAASHGGVASRPLHR